MPQMGVSVAEGTVVEWRKQPGDWVDRDETIGEVSTDKIDTEIPSPASGRVIEILVQVGVTVDCGVTLARIATDADPNAVPPPPPPPPPRIAEAAPVTHVPGPTAASRARPAAPAPHPVAPPPVAHAPSGAGAPSRSFGGSGRAARRYSPVVQRIAEEHDVDLDAIEGTGRDGRVRKQDVMAWVQKHGRGAVAAAPDEPVLHSESPYRAGGGGSNLNGPYVAPEGRPLSRMRAMIGEHMHRSLQTAATCTTWIEVDMSRIEIARKHFGITALPLISRCVIGALVEFPHVNAWLENDLQIVHEQVNLGIAVDLGDDGLIVPVVRGAQDLSPEGLSRRIRDLARRARARQLTPDDVRGGTFTITNPGQFGSVMATPVISLPQVAILDIEAIVKRPVVVTDQFGEDAIAIRPMVILGLSWDHRAIDGALAARFLANVKKRIESYEA
jgi:pyruvate/2-oxoglutarate dehydrogenase complex dihydrolipoamide acyltransferase (E2) component